MNKRKPQTKEEEEIKTIPISFTISVSAVKENVSMLERAIIAENTEVLNLSDVESEVSASSNSVSGMFSLSPTKILIVFDCKENVSDAVSIGSPLWNIFDDVRKWSEGEVFDDRLVWLECFGVHPMYWSEENLRKIGEKWGPVISIDNRVGSLDSLTFARMLVRTKAQNRIDTRVKLLLDHSSCDMWIKEGGSLNECLGAALHTNKSVGRTLEYSQVQSGDAQPPNLDRNSTHDEGPLKIVCAQPSNNNMASKNSDCSAGCLDLFADPLLSHMCSKVVCAEDHGWIDPIVVNETIYASTFVSTPHPSSKPSKPRGRPRKGIDHPASSSNPTPPPPPPLQEAQKTWDTAKVLGISLNDENATLSALRKSKRILILEGNDA